MWKDRGLLLLGVLGFLGLGVFLLYRHYVVGGERVAGVSAPREGALGREDSLSAPLTVEEAEAELVASSGDEVSLYDLYRDYDTNNRILENAEAPFNRGSEPLSQFIARFREDAAFQRARTSLGEGSSTPDFGKLQMAIAPPDSTYFFAAWRELSENEAAFCKGYLGSEMIEEYLFGRKDSQSPWMLLDYFCAEEAIF